VKCLQKRKGNKLNSEKGTSRIVCRRGKGTELWGGRGQVHKYEGGQTGSFAGGGGEKKWKRRKVLLLYRGL